MIDQTKFNEHLKSLHVLTDLLISADTEQEAIEYLDRLLVAALAEIKLGVKSSG